MTGCNPQNKNERSEVRIANFLLPLQEIKVEINGTGDQHIVTIPYGKITDYISLQEGMYQIQFLNTKDSVVLLKKLGIGKEVKYTLSASGIVPLGIWKNSRTLKTKLLEIFDGASAHPDNAMMPKTEIWLDRFEGDKRTGSLRAIHAAPGLGEVEVFIKMNNAYQKLANLSYPKASVREYPLDPGTYPIEVRYASSEVVICQGRVNIKASELTTLFIYRDPDRVMVAIPE